MKCSARVTAAFSLVEITLAMGVAAFCLIAVMGMLPIGLKTQQASIQQTTANEIMTEILGDLRADIRLPPGQASQEQSSGFGLHGHWVQVATPDTLYFTNAAVLTSTVDAFRATITYLFPPNASTSAAKVIVSWPGQVDPATGVPAGSVQTFIAVNR